jgi:Fe2+ or Zn2+ uptake regulation protein
MLAHARITDPETSHEAAESASHRITMCQQAVLTLLLAQNAPLSDAELVFRYQNMTTLPKQSPSGIRSRRHELVLRGLVRDSHQRMRPDGGRAHILWEAVPQEG